MQVYCHRKDSEIRIKWLGNLLLGLASSILRLYSISFRTYDRNLLPTSMGLWQISGRNNLSSLVLTLYTQYSVPQGQQKKQSAQ